MIRIVYFGEMLVASLLAVLLLVISPFRMSIDAALFVGGAVGWTLAEYLVHRFVLHGLAPTQHGLHHANPNGAVLNNLLANLGLFRDDLFDSRGRLRCWHAHRIRLVPSLCIIAPTTVRIDCRSVCSSITRAITDLRPETMVSAPSFGTMFSGRYCDRFS